MQDNDAIFGGRGNIYRYALSRRVEGTDPLGFRLLYVMLNPSTADAESNDPTIRKCLGFAKLNGFSHIRVVNLFALRSTDYRRLALGSDDDHPEPVGPENDYYIDMMARWGLPDFGGKVVVAWGDSNKIPTQYRAERPKTVLEILRKIHGEVFCIGKTLRGDPRHPLMTAYATPLEPYHG